MSKATICLMLKAPASGEVKTRLARSIGSAEACCIYRRLVEHQWNQVRDWPSEVHFSPATSLEVMQSWLGEAEVYIPQPEGHLGDRLRSAMEGAFARGASAVFLIAGDCPDVTPTILDEAEALLRTHDIVLGPAEDGGYYLLGMKAPLAHLFDDIAWSTETVFASTMARINELGLSCGLLPIQADVDDLPSLENARSRHAFLR